MRVLTALVIISVCLFASFRGWNIARFAQAQVVSSRSDVNDLRRWVGVPGVTSAALQATLARAVVSDVEAARQRAQNLIALLSARPLSSEEWLSLAQMRFITGQPENDVQSALLMSSVTGPNEDYVMWQRGLFGLLIWQSLTADARQQTIRDFAGALQGVPLGHSELSAAKYLLSAKTDEVRSEISRLLKGEGISQTDFGRLGL
ncbi:MAG TPA: hypothetical protein VGU20_31365 [Stellaceae bacterium]|nr:hypothetical protein [Stellaceae bacterium]